MKMEKLKFTFYSEVKKEDAEPYADDRFLVVADGLGGSGATVHRIDRDRHRDIHNDIMMSAFDLGCENAPCECDVGEQSAFVKEYLETLVRPMEDERDDTSALLASRIVIGRCVQALTADKFDLANEEERQKIADHISVGLRQVADKFDLKIGNNGGQRLLPTTLALVHYTESEKSMEAQSNQDAASGKTTYITAESVWAGDSRCYVLTPKGGLQLLSKDDEDSTGAITNLFYADNKTCHLNYIRHIIDGPCILMTVSDGVFDPFDPYDYLCVEYAVLSNMDKSDNIESLRNNLKEYYEEIRCDDATMAFAAVGFDDYNDMKRQFSFLTKDITEYYSKLNEYNTAFSVEDFDHYVSIRTGDRYDKIVGLLIDVALSNENKDYPAKAIIQGVRSECEKYIKQSRNEERKRGFDDLTKEVQAHPELVKQNILRAGNSSEKMKDFQNATDMLVGCIKETKDEEGFFTEIANKLQDSSKALIASWDNGTYADSCRCYCILGIWCKIFGDLKYYRDCIPKKNLSYELNDKYIEKYLSDKEDRDLVGQIKVFLTLEYEFLKKWHEMIGKYRNKGIEELKEILSDHAIEVVEKYNLVAVSEALRQSMRVRLDQQEIKDRLVSEIVKGLAESKDSPIEGIYNASNLEKYRSCYKYNNDEKFRSEVDMFKQKLVELETSYKALIETKSGDTTSDETDKINASPEILTERSWNK